MNLRPSWPEVRKEEIHAGRDIERRTVALSVNATKADGPGFGEGTGGAGAEDPKGLPQRAGPAGQTEREKAE